MPFDSLSAAKRLQAAGVEPEQAEAMVDTMSSVFGSELATKADIRTLDGKIDTLGAELHGKINLLQWMFGVLVVFNIAILVRTFMP